MNGYILFKNGSYEYTEFNKKLKYRKGEIKAFLLECYHPVFGFFYVAQDLKAFKKTMKYANKSTITYRFLDGTYVDEETDDELFIKNKYWYYSANDLFSKVMEIVINEYIFNDFFWVYSSFYQYIYDDIEIKLKGSKKKKTLSGNQFYKKYIFDGKNIFDKNVINISDTKKWSNVSIKKASDICLVQLYDNIFFKMDSKIFKLGQYTVESKLYLLIDDPIQDDEPLFTKTLINKLNKTIGLSNLLEIYVSKYVIRHLERIEDHDVYLVECKIKFDNKKLNKKNYKFGKFVRKYFVDIQKY